MADERNLPSSYADSFVPTTSYSADGGITEKLQQAISFVHSSVAVRKIEKLIVQEKPQRAHLRNRDKKAAEQGLRKERKKFDLLPA